MRVAFQLMIFMLMFGLISGVMTEIFPGFNDPTETSYFRSRFGLPGGGGYNTTYITYQSVRGFNQSVAGETSADLNNPVSPTGSGFFAGSTTSFFNSIFDVISGGIISKIGNFVDQYIYGFGRTLDNMFRSDEPFFNPNNIFGISPFKMMINSMITIIYILGLVWLWSGKNTVKESI